ncbi:ABC transporter permease [Cryobacterium sp. TMT1-21]|uniref:ABC transporter permease n=1 Tax=Cryobacterium shii TaxID=1259235 RepID=A0AAQ2HG48_9MICO|nr:MULTISPECIES: ABC transporter permease [Cryobacterium]TFC50137.1 ABC transporter permease [Cryobacterium shii]TFC82489.1 ABC transporter permease [Cryobacterium sp. TmT2-59]TFD12165.1 ABC transporter permease [Cryobacterium sp. TMT1-21]TFD19682.1 ABC transporter permease [Cryobacterium sp. TMT4-10]TFD20635.1 ABC transporter permease [Cryobacterium sp. TMT2-23]
MAFAAFATTTAPEPAARRRSPIALLLLLPGILYLVLFFLAPLVSLLLTSFQKPTEFGDIGQFDYAFRWENYVDVVQAYWPHIVRSFGYALIATVLALLFSYPLAYFIGVKARKWPLLQSLMLVLVIAPFFISFLLRTLAWKQILSDESFIMTSLKALSLMPTDAHFTGTPIAVIFGITYNFIPFMTLPLYTTLERLDLRYLEAGSDLYAHPFEVFRKITIPLSMPGIVAGTLLTFIPAAGDYINASRDFLGGPDTQMMGNVIEANFLVLQNFPAAAALSIILMSVILIVVGIYVKRAGTEELL